MRAFPEAPRQRKKVYAFTAASMRTALPEAEHPPYYPRCEYGN
jgi:hypothetical protein